MTNQEDNPVNKIEFPLIVEQVPLDDDDEANVRADDIIPQQSGSEIPIVLPETFPLILEQVPLDDDKSNVRDDDIMPQQSGTEIPIVLPETFPLTFEQVPLDDDRSNVRDDDIMPQQSGTEIPVVLPETFPIIFDQVPLDDDLSNVGEQTSRMGTLKIEHETLDDEWPIYTEDATENTFEHETLDDEWPIDTKDATENTFGHVEQNADWTHYNYPATEVPTTSVKEPQLNWSHFRDEDIRKQQSAILAIEAAKIPFVGDKEPLSSLEAEYHSGSPILLEKIKLLSEQFDAIRRVRGDGNCFFRAFMFSYLEHIFVSQDRTEVNRIKAKVEECRVTLWNLGHHESTFEDFFELFLEQLDCVLQGNDASISFDDLVLRSRDQSISDSIVMFFRFITSGEIRKRLEFFQPFVLGMTNGSVEQFCRTSVEPMGEESDHVHITALSDALGVAIRVEYLDQSVGHEKYGSYVTVNHHDFIPTNNKNNDNDGGSPPPPPEPKEDYVSFDKKPPFITLLYRPGHYDVLYYNSSSSNSEKNLM